MTPLKVKVDILVISKGVNSPNKSAVNQVCMSRKDDFLIAGFVGRALLTLAGAVDCDCGQCWWIGLSLSQVHGLRPHESSKSDLASHSDFVNLAFLCHSPGFLEPVLSSY